MVLEKHTFEEIKGLCDNNFDWVPENSKISDSRSSKDFKTQSFGGELKTKVSTAMEKEIMSEKVASATYCAFQLFLTGVVEPLWAKLMNIAAKQINISNPLLPLFLMIKCKRFYSILSSTKNASQVLQLRNHSEMRNLIVELTSLLSISRKRKLEALPKIKKTDFMFEIFKNKFDAKDTMLVDKILQPEDPSEIRVVANEFAHHLKNRNNYKTLYWLNWILEWEKANKKRYGKFEVSPRTVEGVNIKFNRQVIWLIWTIINVIRKQNFTIDGLVGARENKQIDAIWTIFRRDYTSGKQSSRIPLVMWAIKYMTGEIDWKIPLIDKETHHFQAIMNVNTMVKNIKSQEIDKYACYNQKYNFVIHDNFLMTEKHSNLVKDKTDKEKRKEEDLKNKALHKEKVAFEKRAKKCKIDVVSLNKLDMMAKLDEL